MNIWEYLGIEVTQDERAIKRAYAVLLKQCQPETDPNGFILLRSAYEAALKFARNRASLETPESEETFWRVEDIVEEYETHSEVESEKVPVVLNTAQNNTFNLEASAIYNLQNEKSKYEVAQAILEETKKLLQNDVGKLIKSNWLLIFQHPDMWNLQAKETYIELLFDFFAKSNIQITLPSKIWLLINQFCLWRERELELYRVYSSDKVDSVLYPIRVALKERTVLRMKKANLMKILSRDIMVLKDLATYPVAMEKSSPFLMNMFSLAWYFLIKIKDIILSVGGFLLLLSFILIGIIGLSDSP